MCDASASVMADADHFLAASDEDNVLRLYRLDAAGGPVGTFPWGGHLGIDPDDKHPEADIEAAARVGNRVYWITSHGANKEGKPRSNRRRFFATDLSSLAGGVGLSPAGVPFRQLIEVMAGTPGLKALDLVERSKNPPESAGGLNIEGLTATPGGTLLIGFRNPVPEGAALLVPFENPDAVLTNGEAPRLGYPVFLDLGGLSVRSIDFAPAHGAFFIVAGAVGDGGTSRLFRWTGAAGDRPVSLPHAELAGLNPEAVVAPPAPQQDLLLLSDDGDRPVGTRKCKDVEPAGRKFRSLWITP